MVPDNVDLVLPLTALAALNSRHGRYGEAEELLYRVLRLGKRPKEHKTWRSPIALENIRRGWSSLQASIGRPNRSTASARVVDRI